MDPFGAADWDTHSTRNTKKAEHCHRPMVSCSSVNSDHLICQHDQEAVSSRSHLPALRSCASCACTGTETAKRHPKTYLVFIYFSRHPWSKLELSKSRKSCSMGSCFRLCWKRWDEKNLDSFKQQTVSWKWLCCLEGLVHSAQIAQDRSPAMYEPCDSHVVPQGSEVTWIFPTEKKNLWPETKNEEKPGK